MGFKKKSKKIDSNKRVGSEGTGWGVGGSEYKMEYVHERIFRSAHTVYRYFPQRAPKLKYLKNKK